MLKWLKKNSLYLGIGCFITLSLNSTVVVESATVQVTDTISMDYCVRDTITEYVEPTIISFDNINFEDIDVFNLNFSLEDIAPADRILASYSVPDGEGICNSSTKTWMCYKKVTNKRSKQYSLLNSDECYTDPVTGLRMIGDRICIAMGTGYVGEENPIGTKVNLVMASCYVVKCIIGDIKANAHTDETRRYQKFDGSVAEMIIDSSIFTGTHQYPSTLKGKIIRVDIVEER